MSENERGEMFHVFSLQSQLSDIGAPEVQGGGDRQADGPTAQVRDEDLLSGEICRAKGRKMV